MPLNLSVGDGDFTPFLKYNAKAGRFYIRPDGGAEDIEIVNPTLAFDLANIKTGWLFYAEGSGPEKIWDPSPTQAAPKPRDPRKFKRGFEVQVYSNAMIPRTQQKIGLREFSSTAANVIAAIIRMYAEYEEGLAANPNSVPIFACDGVRPVTGAYGTNYEPLFTLKGWVQRTRIPEFDERAEPVAPTPAPIAHGNKPVNVTESVLVKSKFDERNPPPFIAPAPTLDDEIPF